jgi:hypothetical protein
LNKKENKYLFFFIKKIAALIHNGSNVCEISLQKFIAFKYNRKDKSGMRRRTSRRKKRRRKQKKGKDEQEEEQKIANYIVYICFATEPT